MLLLQLSWVLSGPWISQQAIWTQHSFQTLILNHWPVLLMNVDRWIQIWWMMNPLMNSNPLDGFEWDNLQIQHLCCLTRTHDQSLLYQGYTVTTHTTQQHMLLHKGTYILSRTLKILQGVFFSIIWRNERDGGCFKVCTSIGLPSPANRRLCSSSASSSVPL
jgi:hypothetical protein